MYWVAVVAAGVVGVAPLVATGVEQERGPTGFSIDKALTHIDRVAQQPHPIGSAANQDVRDYVADELRSLGLEPEFQTVRAPAYYRDSGTVAVVNVMARIAGTDPTGAVVVVAHLDTVPETPGANDNASGVAVTLEAARSLLSGGPLRNDVIVLFTDGEEPAPRYGSTAFVDDHRWFDDARFIVNLEALGTGGPSLLSETNGPQSWVLDHLVASAPHPVVYSFLTETATLIGGSNTDFARFRDAGVPGVEFAYLRGSSIYHAEHDTVDSVSRWSLNSHGVNTLGLVRHLATEDLGTAVGDDMVFFTVGRFHVVRYPTSWAVPIVVAAGVFLLAATRRRRVWPVVTRDAATTLISALLAAIASAVLWTPFARWRDTMGVFESYSALAVLVALTALALIIPSKFGQRVGGERTPEGVLLVWWSLALLTAVAAPGMSYLFVLPALVGASALLLGFDAAEGWQGLAPAVLTIGTAMVVIIPAIDTLFVFAQPRPGNPDSEILPTVAVPVLLAALVIQLALVYRLRPTEGSRVDHVRVARRASCGPGQGGGESGSVRRGPGVQNNFPGVSPWRVLPSTTTPLRPPRRIRISAGQRAAPIPAPGVVAL